MSWEEKRAAYTKELVRKCRGEFPDYSCVVVIDRNSRSVSGNDYRRVDSELWVDCCTKFKYNMYITQNFKPFSFTNKGDGGYIN